VSKGDVVTGNKKALITYWGGRDQGQSFGTFGG